MLAKGIHSQADDEIKFPPVRLPGDQWRDRKAAASRESFADPTRGGREWIFTIKQLEVSDRLIRSTSKVKETTPVARIVTHRQGFGLPHHRYRLSGEKAVVIGGIGAEAIGLHLHGRCGHGLAQTLLRKMNQLISR